MNQVTLKSDLEYVTQNRQLPDGTTFGQVLARLDALAARGDLPDRLQHYLSRRSYLKALAWLENPDTPHHP